MRLFRLLLPVCILALAPVLPIAAMDGAPTPDTKFWVGGNGDWNDGANWSRTPQGAGGAGVPKANESVVVAASAPMHLVLPASAKCAGLDISGPVHVTAAPGAELVIAGSWRMRPPVRWEHGGRVMLRQRNGDVHIDVGGVAIASALVIDVAGQAQLRSDLVCAPGGTITLANGTLYARNALVQAEALLKGAGTAGAQLTQSVLMLSMAPAPDLMAHIQQQASVLVVNEQVQNWPGGAIDTAAMGDRDINICGTDPGQTPFMIDAQVTTDYNGYAVACRGECNATVTVSVTGGSGNFTYNWLNGGPPTQTWTSACGGPQIVIVTDVTQNISCPVSVTVNEPPPLGVIFLGPGTPPSCHDVCNGSRSAFGVGGVAPITYNWNNGAGTGSSFNQLCDGPNTLVVSDLNGCTFDTTFVYAVLPIEPGLTFTNETCFGGCDGAAEVAPVGGTGGLSIHWQPGGQVGPQVTGLCAGDHSVTITDANGCDTTVVFTIEPAEPFIITLDSTDETCAGACDGSATVTASGGSGTFTFLWSPPPGGGQGTGTVMGLCAGSYTVTITDPVNDCDTTLVVQIDAPPTLQVVPTLTDATCANSCDGAIALVVSGGTGTPTYNWTPDPGPGQGAPNVGPLCPGNWMVTITDAAGCDTTITYTIQAPDPLDVQAATTGVSCAGACDGSAEVTITGGTPDHVLTWTPAPGTGQGTPTPGAMCAGSYMLHVVDAQGCDTTITVVIEEPEPLQATHTLTPVSCAGVCDASVSVQVTGGVEPLQYAWSPAPANGQGTPNASGFCGGNVVLTITDANGCELVLPITIDEPDPLEANLQVTPASCPGTCDGSALATVTGGTGIITYIWSPEPGAGQGTANATGLCAGAFTLTVRDEALCETVIPFTVAAPDPITVNATVTPIACAGECTGAISLNVTGGNGPFTYAWAGSPAGDGTPSVTGLCPGEWQVTISSGACDTTLVFQLEDPVPLIVTVTATPIGCLGVCDGTATVDIQGGAPPFAITWMPPAPQNPAPNIGAGYCAGTYSVNVEDSLGCAVDVPFTILDTQPFTVDLMLTEADCGNACNGTASAAVTGGVGALTYTWTPAPGDGQGTPNATGLCPGPYTLLITDTATGCDTLINVTIEQPPVVSAIAHVTDAGCAGECDGAIAVEVTASVGQLTFTWTPDVTGQGTANATALCPGEYSVLIADTEGCDTTLVVNVGEPAPLLVNPTVTPVTCAGECNGAIALDVTGGPGAYTYAWSGSPAGDGTPSVTGLCPGEWSVTITSGSCDTTLVFLLTVPDPLVVDVVTTPVGCQGVCDGTATLDIQGGTVPYVITWTPAAPQNPEPHIGAGFCAGTYSVNVEDAQGCSVDLPFTILDSPPITVDLTLSDAGCGDACNGTAVAMVGGTVGPVEYTWSPPPGGGQGTSSVDGLCPGLYSLHVLDTATGCETQVTFTIVQPFGVMATPHVTDVSCAGSCDGSVQVDVTGGIGQLGFVWTPEVNGQGTANATDLCPGIYSLLITDAGGCDTTLTMTVGEPTLLSATETITQSSCGGVCEGTIDVVVGGGSGGYVYLWDPQPPAGQGTSTASGLCPGTWNLTVTDLHGCDTTFTYVLQEPDPLQVDLVVTNSECQLCNGGGQVTITGGSLPILVLWTTLDGVLVDVGDNLSNACAGNYVVTVTDAAGCSVVLPVLISDSNGEAITVSDGQTTCPDSCDGTVSVDFDCSDPDCTVQWTDGDGNVVGTASTVDGLCAGTYTVQVTNATGCITLGTATVTNPQPLNVSLNVNDVSCAGGCDGSIVVNFTGGTAPYDMTWSPEPAEGQGTPYASGLCPGSYNLNITDDDGCITLLMAQVTEPSPLVVDAQVTQAGCVGDCNGSITLFVTGGTGAPTVIWDPVPPNGQGVTSAQGLCPGDWTATVHDGNGCTIMQTWTISASEGPALVVNSTPAHCAVCDGTATVEVTGGSGPYNVAWSLAGMPMGVTPTITDLCAGVYHVVATDAFGCAGTSSVAVTDVGAETIDVTTTPVTCAGDCDGTATVTFDCGTPDCTIAWSDANGFPVAGDTTTVEGLCEGLWYVSVTNGDQCTAIAPAVIGAATAIASNAVVTPESCAGACDGAVLVAPTGGMAPYTYAWSPEPGNGQGTDQVTGLCAGLYTVTIADVNGCMRVDSILVPAPTQVAIAGIVQEPVCNGACDGAITAIATGGSGPYTYLWSPEPASGQGTASATGFCAGPVSLTVTDANGCSATASWTLSAPDPIAISFNTTPSSCGVCTGTATATATGGTPDHSWFWLLGTNVMGTGDQISGLCAGLYTVVATDANGCQVTQVVPVEDIDGEDTAVTNGQVSCPGDCDGSVSISTPCVDGPCTIAWYDAQGVALGQTGSEATGLCAGLYLVMVTNASGCVSIDTAMVMSPLPVLANLTTTPVSCFGDCDGTATVSPSGGAGGYTVEWLPGGETSSTLTGLCVGEIAVVITDQLGCSVTTPVEITGPEPLQANATIVGAGCSGECNGSITLDIVGGNGGNTFLWSPNVTGQGTATASGLCPGTYRVTITDALGCAVTYTYTLSEPVEMSIALDLTHNSCFGECMGAALLTITGGAPDHAITWTGPNGVIAQDVMGINGLCAGTYTVNVVDANACTLSESFTITQGDPIGPGLTFIGETCNGPCDGTATVAPTGGAGGPYTFLWQPGGQTDATVTGLCAGEHSVTITDAAGCDTTVTFTILPWTVITDNAVVTDVACAGQCTGSIVLTPSGGIGSFSYTWVPDAGGGPTIADQCAGTYQVTITDSVGCTGTFNYTIGAPDTPLTVDVTAVIPASCITSNDGAITIAANGGTPDHTIAWTGPGGFVGDQPAITGLISGTYTLTVTDANGCTVTMDVVVDALQGVVADAGADQQVCAGAPVTLDGRASTGASGHVWYNDLGEELGTGPLIDVTDLPPGQHTFTLVATDGPCADTAQVTVEVFTTPVADAGPDQTIFVDEEVVLGGSPTGPPGATFSWSPDSVLIAPHTPNPTGFPTVTTWFVVTVTTPEGCTAQDSVLVTVVPEVDIPSGFTPNGDGWNDTWVIGLIELFPLCEVEIYNRWGEMLFRSVGYNTPWDGRYNGAPVPVGTYYYVIQLNDERFPDAYTGPLTIIR